MPDLLGAIVVALIGTLICVSGYLNFRGVKKLTRGSHRWSRTNAHVTKSWRQDVSGAAGDMTYHVNYTFTAPETGGNYYGHSEHGHQDVKTGDEIEVMYDPRAPYNNDLPTARANRVFFLIAYGILAVFGAIMVIGGLVGTVVVAAGF